ncbi:hypothetical protein FDECE_5398 [Fusarium decemcellulare]|nr:hypothetical protein FDECE_5398 [Fusarium decemcellulare]
MASTNPKTSLPEKMTNRPTSRASGEIGPEKTLDALKQSDGPRTEYEEYLDLSREFTGKRLSKLIQKVEHANAFTVGGCGWADMGELAGNAKLFGAIPDMGMTGQDWNTALSVFFVTYAAGGVPSNIALKRFGPKIWLPVLLFMVSLILIFSSMQNNRGGWIAFRVLLGLFEAGVFPGCSFILTYWYSPAEIHSRMTIFYCGASAAGAFSGLLAYAIGNLDYTWGFRGWRFIYCIEGLFSLILSIVAFFLLNDTPTKVTKWLGPDEKRFLILRHRYAAGGETGVAEKEEFSWKAAREAFSSFHIYAVALMEFTLCVTVYGYSFILPTIIKNLGYSAAEAQAMTVPPYIFACIVTVFSGWAADRYRQRMLSVLLPNLLAACGFIVMMVSSRYEHLPGVTLFGVFLATAGLYPISPAVTAWIALNCAGSMKRAVGIGAMISFSQLGGIVGSNIYIAEQSPTYPVGFGISLGMLSSVFLSPPQPYKPSPLHRSKPRAHLDSRSFSLGFCVTTSGNLIMSPDIALAADVRRNGGRRSTACRRCHKQKVKCTRERPCRNCEAARVECVYPQRDRVVSVPESYLRALEAGRDSRNESPRSLRSVSRATADDDVEPAPNDSSVGDPSHHPIENSAAEVFVEKVKQLRQNTTFSANSDTSPDVDRESNVPPKSPMPLAASYEYFPLAYDTSQPQLSLYLPPLPYAIHLLDQVEIYMGHDYHWFLWKDFKERMHSTYKRPESSESRDRLWLCKILVVFALGETFVRHRAPAIHLGSNPHHDRGLGDEASYAALSPSAPGAKFFEQALALLKLPFEDPTVEYVETLNLTAFYSFSLNRKKTAYMYAGMSARTCNLLRLDQPSPQTIYSNPEQEHRKRVCWTSYCLDKMTSSELGLIPSFQPGQIKVEYPGDDLLGPQDVGQFHEADFLRARIQITLMKAEADVFINLWQSIRDDIPDVERRAKPILNKLESWLRELPAHMSFDCESGMPEVMTQLPTMRSLASSYLRCYQCFILLLRPLFLKYITHILSDEICEKSQDSLKALSGRCVRAARTNLCILIGLWHHDRIAMTANRWRPESFEEKGSDLTTYSTGKDILRAMVRAGNLASKGHERMLVDVEALGEALGAMQMEGVEPVAEQWDMDDWITQVLSLDPASTMFNSLE